MYPLEDKLDARNAEHGRLGKLRRTSGLFTSEQEMLCVIGVEVRSAIRRVSDRGSSRLGACRAGLRTLFIATNTGSGLSRIDGSSKVDSVVNARVATSQGMPRTRISKHTSGDAQHVPCDAFRPESRCISSARSSGKFSTVVPYSTYSSGLLAPVCTQN